ncbi:MAG: MBL fold metallo-hydrolase [Chitinophagaceae bacterium]|nr:MBL fold metallo-hydrolase [Chitinophagaceae bacterium]
MRLLNILLCCAFVCSLAAQQPFIIVLGNVQDGGSPHIGCTKNCCISLFKKSDPSRKVTALGIADPSRKSSYLFEATPDITSQLRLLKEFSQTPTDIPNGIFLTHAHIGHYSGLLFLGKEAINASQVPVYAMPRMEGFLKQNGPWGQLISFKNIELKQIQSGVSIPLSNDLQIIPFIVPHRDEYSETVGYKIIGPNKKALFIPDIDKWEKWNKDIRQEIAEVDYAFIDATFFDAAEINNRDIKEIPHPFIIETIHLFKALPITEKKKIYFIHLNHTNPAMLKDSKQSKLILQQGFNIARFKDEFKL